MTNIVPNLNPGTGYYLTLTNIVNYTDVYATSETFEVKTKGSRCCQLIPLVAVVYVSV